MSVNVRGSMNIAHLRLYWMFIPPNRIVRLNKNLQQMHKRNQRVIMIHQADGDFER